MSGLESEVPDTERVEVVGTWAAPIFAEMLETETQTEAEQEEPPIFAMRGL